MEQFPSCLGMFVVVVFLVLSVSALHWALPEFRTDQRPESILGKPINDHCKVCFSKRDCFILNHVRCEYYTEINKILSKEEEPADRATNPRLRADVNALMYSLMEEGKTGTEFNECIPFISKYTDCQKDNICMGCQTCECTELGRFNCSYMQECRPTLFRPIADHRTLQMVLESLNQDTISTRQKRSVEDRDIEEHEIDDGKVSHAKLSEWINEEPTLDIEADSDEIMFEDPNQYLEPTRTRQHKRNNIKLLKFIINSLISDALPEIFKESSAEFENNRVKRWISNRTHINRTKEKLKEETTAKNKITFEELSEWLRHIHPFILIDEKNETFTEPNNTKIFTENTLTTTTSLNYKFAETTAINNITTSTTSQPNPEYIAFEEVYNNIAVDNTAVDSTAVDNTAVDKTAVDNTTVDNTAVDNTAVDNTAVDNTSVDNTALDNTAVDNTTVDNTAVDNTAVDNTAVDNTAVDNTAVDNKNSIKRKPLDAVKEGYNMDLNMYDDNYDDEARKTTELKPTLDYSNVKNIIDKITVTPYDNENATSNDVTEFWQSVTENVIDLLEPDKKSELNNETDDVELTNQIESTGFNKFDNINAGNIMKRDVSAITELDSSVIESTINNTSVNNITNITNPVQDLKEDVLDPLENILNDKQKEIEELVKIKENLISFINTHKETNLNMSAKNSYLSIYKLEVVPHHDPHDLRKSNTTVLDKYLSKLKRDIYEVIRDVIGIRKLYSDATQVPAELNYLIRSLKHYIHKTGFRPNQGKNKNFRRSFRPSSLKTAMVRVIELLDSKLPQTDALEPLSPHSRRVIKRIIKKNYVEELSGTGLRIYDPNYNLTNDLRGVGTQWWIFTSLVETSPLPDKLYNMKRLHLALSVDIAKMNDALALINFARGRRMAPVDEEEGVSIVSKINRNLKSIKKRINRIMSLEEDIQSTKIDTEPEVIIKKNKKDSFLVQIKKLLQKSKKDIKKLLRKKVPKSDIVKEIARKNVEEITRKKLEDTMLKWQSNLNIIPRERREKRSVNGFNDMSRRIKNIIPKYLRGKVPSTLGKNKKKLKKNKMQNITSEYKKKWTTTKSAIGFTTGTPLYTKLPTFIKT